MDDKKLTELLGLSRFEEIPKRTSYPAFIDERLKLNGKPLDYLQIKPEDYPRNSIVFISAPYNCGKSYFTHTAIAGSQITILPRIILGREVVRESNNNLTFYIDDEGKYLSKSELAETDRLVIGSQSQKRLRNSDKKLKGRDNFIIEEASLIFKDLVGDTSRAPRENEQAMCHLIEKSNRVFVIGWVFRDYVFDYLERIAEKSKKEIIFDFWHKEIATDIEVFDYPNTDQFFEKLNEDAKSQRVILLTDYSNGAKSIVKRIKHSVDYFNSDKQPSSEQLEAYANPNKQGMTKQVEIFSPIVSHGVNFRNETTKTYLLFQNSNMGRLDAEDTSQFLWRNREQKEIHTYICEPKELKTLEQLEQIARTPVQITSEQADYFGEWNRTMGQLMVNPSEPMVHIKKEADNIARIEKSLLKATTFLYLRKLGVKEENIHRVPEDESRERFTANRITNEQIIEHGSFVQSAKYSYATDYEQKYTDICNAFGVEEITEKDVKRWDRGNFKENELRQKQMYEDRFVKDAHNRSKGIFNSNKRFGLYQYHLGTYMKDKEHITNKDFKHSEFWQKAQEYKTDFNNTMRFEHLPELCITSDDNACPLRWLERYLTKHNFYCVIYRPSKDKKAEIRKSAEKSCKKEYTDWKEKQKPIIQLVKKLKNEKLSHFEEHITRNKIKELDKEIKWCGKENIRIEHFIQYLVKENRHAELTDEMKALRLIYDQWNMSIESY